MIQYNEVTRSIYDSKARMCTMWDVTQCLFLLYFETDWKGFTLPPINEKW